MGMGGPGVAGGIRMLPGRASVGFCMMATLEEEGEGPHLLPPHTAMPPTPCYAAFCRLAPPGHLIFLLCYKLRCLFGEPLKRQSGNECA